MPAREGSTSTGICLYDNLIMYSLHEWRGHVRSLGLEQASPPSHAQDFSQALLWGPNLFYSLRREPALTALGTRCGIEAFQWPRQSPLLLRWLRPRALDLPRGSRLVGPTPMGDRVALHSQGTAPGASSHLYAVHAANGTLAWQADVAALVSEGQLPQPLTDMVITDVLFDFPGLMITASLHQPLPAKGNGNVTDDHDWGLAAEWLTNGTLRWASDALVPAPIRVAGSTELMAIAVSAPDRDRDTTLFGLSRESGTSGRIVPLTGGSRIYRAGAVTQFWIGSCLNLAGVRNNINKISLGRELFLSV